MEFEEQLALALRTAGGAVTPPVEELVRAGRREGERLRRRRTRGAIALGGGVGVAAAVAIAVGPGLGSPDPTAPPAAGPTAPAACSSAVQTGPLPVWAQTGFSDPEAGGVPYVLGAEGNIAAVLFGDPLTAPEDTGRSDKILWVSRIDAQPLQPLVIDAQLAGTSERTRREVPGGPGPSSVVLPKPGCWHLTLTWDNGGQSDHLDLTYVKPS